MPIRDAEHPEKAEHLEKARHPEKALRCVIAEDSVLLRAGVLRLLTERGFEVVGDGEELLRAVAEH